MHPTAIIRLLNDVLRRIDHSIKLPTHTDEGQIEPQLRMMLSMYDKLASVKRARKKRAPANPAHFEFRLGESQRRGPAGGSRVKDFVSSLTSAGVPLQKAFDQAVRLNVGGASNE